jgi:exodeoxyribonuclease VII small subunit
VISDLSFENALKELEDIVQRLELGDLTLEEAIDVYQKGILLSKYLGKKLDDVEKRITMIIDDNDGELKEKDIKGGTI